MLPNLKSLGVFAKVAETLSFSAAAKALNISAPVVSQHISQLEESLDTALIYRSTRSLTLTESGQKLARHAREMLDAAETGLEEIQTDVREYKGRLTITAPSFIAAPKFMETMVEFSEIYPNIDVAISFSTQIVNLIDSGFDLAIRVGDLQDSNLRARKLLDGHAHIYASPAYIEAHGMPKSPEDLLSPNHKWIVPFMWEDLRLHRLDKPEVVVPLPIEGRFHFDNGEAEKQMALLGKGLSLMPEIYVLKELEEGSLVRVLPEWATEDVGVYAVWPQNAGRRSLTRIFVDFLASSDVIRNPLHRE